MGQDELERLFEQQMFSELAEAAIEEMRNTGKSFEKLFPSPASDSQEKRKFRERIRKAVQINLLPVPSRGTVSSLRFE
jgi:hypothetical protein